MPPNITGIAHVELSVTELDRSVDWYCRLLGARDVWRGANEGGGYKFSPLVPGLEHLSFRVADRAAIDAWAVWMDEIGVAQDAVNDSGPAVTLNLRDPDGIALEFYYLPPRQ